MDIINLGHGLGNSGSACSVHDFLECAHSDALSECFLGELSRQGGLVDKDKILDHRSHALTLHLNNLLYDSLCSLQNKYQGAILGDDGCTYAIPSDASFVLKIDTLDNDRISKIEGFSDPGCKDKFQGAGKGEGKIFFIPENYHCPVVLHLDTGLIEELS